MAGIPDYLKSMWEEGFFQKEVSFSDIALYLSERGINPSANSLRTAVSRAMFLTERRGAGGGVRYIQSEPAVSRAVDVASSELFDEAFIHSLGKPFKKDVDDLHINFGKSGTCTAFLLRKILEKLIYLAFAKQGMANKLDDPRGNGRLVGLEAMIHTAAKEKVGGIPFLTPATAKKIEGIKFLGDVSAHNPLINIDMTDILPEMSYIRAAYRELVTKL